MLLVVCGNPMQQQHREVRNWIYLELEVGARNLLGIEYNPIIQSIHRSLVLPAIFARITSIAAKVLYRSLLSLRPAADQFCGIHSFDGD
jgi:hypothetical protein